MEECLEDTRKGQLERNRREVAEKDKSPHVGSEHGWNGKIGTGQHTMSCITSGGPQRSTRARTKTIKKEKSATMTANRLKVSFFARKTSPTSEELSHYFCGAAHRIETRPIFKSGPMSDRNKVERCQIVARKLHNKNQSFRAHSICSDHTGYRFKRTVFSRSVDCRFGCNLTIWP